MYNDGKDGMLSVFALKVLRVMLLAVFRTPASLYAADNLIPCTPHANVDSTPSVVICIDLQAWSQSPLSVCGHSNTRGQYQPVSVGKHCIATKSPKQTYSSEQ